MARLWLPLIFVVCLASREAFAEEPIRSLPPAAQEADVDEHIGAQIPPDITLVGESGERITTAALFSGNRPVVLVLAYYRCPMLCPTLLAGVLKGLFDAGFAPGDDYRLVTVSIDPEDTPIDAQKRKNSLAATVGQSLDNGVRFVVADAEESRKLAKSVGFRYGYDSATQQYAHPAVVTVLSSGARISRYLYGIEPSARDLRFAVLEAAQGKIGTIVDRVIITCFRFDPATRRYGPYILGFFRIGATLILTAIGTLLFVFWRIERRRSRRSHST